MVLTLLIISYYVAFLTLYPRPKFGSNLVINVEEDICGGFLLGVVSHTIELF